MTTLPRSGGLAAKVSKARFSTKRRTGRDPGVTLVAKKDIDLRSLDRGRLRHPVFGNRRVWVNQAVRAGWFTDAVEGVAPEVRREIVRVLDNIAEELARRG